MILFLRLLFNSYADTRTSQKRELTIRVSGLIKEFLLSGICNKGTPLEKRDLGTHFASDSSVGLSDIAHLNRDKRRRGNDSRCIQQGNVRKTRLSFELHPNLLLHDFIMELEAMGSGSHRIFDDEEESSEQQPQREVQEQEAP